MADLSTLSDEEIIKHLPDEVLLQHIQSRDVPAQQTFSQLSPLQQVFYPSTFVREGIGQQVGRDLQTAQDVVGTTGLGQLASAATTPAIRALASRVPQQVGELAGIAASLPVDPSTYAFGGIGTLPNRILRTALGATAGGVAASGQPQSTPGSVALGTALGGVGSGLTRITKRGVSLEPPNVTRIPDFLRGNPKAIGQAEDALDRAAHQTVIAVRKGGKLHNQVMETLSRESAKAWAPMQQVANAIPGEIPLAEVKTSLQARLARDPNRLQAATTVLNDLEESSPTLTAPGLADLSSNLSNFIKKAALRGKQAMAFSDLVYTDLKGAIADVLEMRAPQEMKGFVAQAKQQWGQYAADRDALFRYFQPTGVSNQPTAAGVNVLKRSALKQSSPYEQDLLQRLKDASGLDLPETIKPFAKALMKAQKRGGFGKRVGQAGLGTLGLYGAGKFLRPLILSGGDSSNR